MKVLSGDEKRDYLNATFQKQLLCPKCRAVFSFEEGVISALENGIREKVVMCPNCHSIYQAQVTARDVSLLDDVTHRFTQQKQVAQPIQKFKPESPKTTPHTHSSKRRRGLGFVWLLALLAIALFGYSAVRYSIDRGNYRDGHQAYLRADCETAISHFDKVIQGWRFVDIGGYPNLAQQEKTECLPFQAAADRQQDGDLCAALVAYADHFSRYRGSVLAGAASDRVTFLLEHAEPSALACWESCERIATPREGELSLQDEVDLAAFYFACGQVFDTLNYPQGAFTMYESLLSEYPNHSLAREAEAFLIANSVACDRVNSLRKNSTIADRPNLMPAPIYQCGQAFEVDRVWAAVAMYELLLTEYPDHSLAAEVEASFVENPSACERVDSLRENSTIARRPNLMPTLYYNCGQEYEKQSNWAKAKAMYELLLTEYPDHSLAAEVEASFLENPSACEMVDLLRKNSTVAERPNLLPTLYYNCGQEYEKQSNWANAIAMYEDFLSGYPSHSLASEVEAALARSIVAWARATSGGEIPAPERSGSTGSGFAEVVIQNDSPKRLRIVFSGPESRVAELDACSSCTNYTGAGPLYCPEKGPIGRYTLTPGQYDVVVESVSDSGTRPWTGDWSLGRGNQYHSCFFIIELGP
ncbi:MAG: tetratricopeptide repeat protein [Anaerolineae bacterium]|nr:tetratricopeptide repeat protein [Anaerolineae bacterium]